ncbi:hypothetical protein [Clostridium estertheticum]|uniref:hypothetical protein n=1 Tax=Clostridium estertheticum TaxID=238834 RepID=UPI001C6F5606|nr:hypothetical protein [Clostridium estertheticum]MBW9151461.1 hypothetical protein [Clostridium estertheticum]WLC83402.1 hypothetical protein KTC97_15065 [Clostridium estertheticum]
MQVKDRNFPHPVLSNSTDDIIESKFYVEFNEKIEDGNLKCDVVINLNNDDILELIKSNRASYIIHLECPSTRYRSVYRFNDTSFKFEIDASKVDRKVEMNSFITASEDIVKYNNSKFNEDYDDMSFKIKKGDIIAVGNSKILKLEKQQDVVTKVPSIFIITRNSVTNPQDVFWEDEDKKVIIKLAPALFDKYKSLSKNESCKPVLSSLIIVPVLTEIISDVKYNIGDNNPYEDKTWYKVIEKRIKKLDISMDNPASTIAQQLLGNTFINSINSLENIILEG